MKIFSLNPQAALSSKPLFYPQVISFIMTPMLSAQAVHFFLASVDFLKISMFGVFGGLWFFFSCCLSQTLNSGIII